jgi:hypothetical protein
MLKSESIPVSSWFVSGHRGKAILRPNDELILVVDLQTATCLVPVGDEGEAVCASIHSRVMPAAVIAKVRF